MARGEGAAYGETGGNPTVREGAKPERGCFFRASFLELAHTASYSVAASSALILRLTLIFKHRDEDILQPLSRDRVRHSHAARRNYSPLEHLARESAGLVRRLHPWVLSSLWSVARRQRCS